MSLWEYKVITSGKGGFATPALLEKFLNDLGRDEWEIIHFQTPPDNFLAFTGLARRSTQRDWTLEDAAAAAAKAEAEKLRAEFEAKFKAAASSGPAAIIEERAPSFLEEKLAPDDGFRKPVDTSHDDEPEDQEEEKADEWDKLTAAEEDELPTFFEAIKPHMRRNQRGPGMSVGVDYLAKKWDQTEDDLKGALTECGFMVPTDEDAKPEYVEYDGDLYWLNVNRRGELWINTKEKPRPVFRPVKAARVEVEAPPAKEPAVAKGSGGTSEEGAAPGEATPESGEHMGEQKPETGDRKPEGLESSTQPKVSLAKAQNGGSLPEGPALLDKIRPHMRRNRRGPGGSGSASFLSRALRTNEAELRRAFAALGLTLPATSADKAVYSEFGNEIWWLNLDSRGGLWINGREKKAGETLTAPAEASSEAPLESVPGSAAPDAVPAPEVAPAVASASDFEAPAAASSPATETPPTETAPGEMPTTGIAGDRSAPADRAVPETPRDDMPAEKAPEGVNPVPATVAPPASAAPSEKEPSLEFAHVPPNAALAAVRSLLKETKAGLAAGKVDRLADELGRPPEEFVATLVDAGLRVPEKSREKPVFVEHAGEVLWLNKNAKGELWLNVKSPKAAQKESEADEVEESPEASEGGEGDADKKAGRRGGGRVRTKKTE